MRILRRLKSDIVVAFGFATPPPMYTRALVPPYFETCLAILPDVICNEEPHRAKDTGQPCAGVENVCPYFGFRLQGWASFGITQCFPEACHICHIRGICCEQFAFAFGNYHPLSVVHTWLPQSVSEARGWMAVAVAAWFAWFAYQRDRFLPSCGMMPIQCCMQYPGDSLNSGAVFICKSL